MFLFLCYFFIYSGMFVISHWSIFIMLAPFWSNHSNVSVISTLKSFTYLFPFILKSGSWYKKWFSLETTYSLYAVKLDLVQILFWLAFSNTALRGKAGTVSLRPREARVQVPLRLSWHLRVSWVEVAILAFCEVSTVTSLRWPHSCWEVVKVLTPPRLHWHHAQKGSRGHLITGGRGRSRGPPLMVSPAATAWRRRSYCLEWVEVPAACWAFSDTAPLQSWGASFLPHQGGSLGSLLISFCWRG